MPRRGPLVSLTLLSIALFASWRAEHAVYGLDGLGWISAPRWCVPLGVCAFVGWLVVAVASLPRTSGIGARTALVAVALGLAYVAIPFFEFVLRVRYVTGPFAIFWIDHPYRDPRVPIGIATLTTLLTFGIGSVFGVRAPVWMLSSSLALVLGAGAWGRGLLPFFTRNDDFIEVVKHGTAIPFVVFGLGLPWTVRPGPTPLARPHPGSSSGREDPNPYRAPERLTRGFRSPCFRVLCAGRSSRRAPSWVRFCPRR